MNWLAARRAPEAELYQKLGFPDFFTDDALDPRDDGPGLPPMKVQYLSPSGYPDRYRVYCRATGEHLGPLYRVQPQLLRDIGEEEHFAEEDRATCWPLSATGYALTGDGEIVRREKRGWLHLGPAREALLIRPPKAERRKQGSIPCT